MSEESEVQYLFNKFKAGVNRGLQIVNIRSKKLMIVS